MFPLPFPSPSPSSLAVAGGHNTHASGIGQRKGKRHTHTGNRACKWRSPDNFATANLTHLQQYDLSVAASAAPSEEELIKVRPPPSPPFFPSLPLHLVHRGLLVQRLCSASAPRPAVAAR